MQPASRKWKKARKATASIDANVYQLTDAAHVEDDAALHDAKASDEQDEDPRCLRDGAAAAF
eukprot:6293365-Alexandrium_andersonii.AAC.1